jgi:hypothetical protein
VAEMEAASMEAAMEATMEAAMAAAMKAVAAIMEACLVEDETEADAETVERTAEWAAEAVMRPLHSGSRRVAAQAGVARRADDGTVYLASRTVRKTNQL